MQHQKSRWTFFKGFPLAGCVYAVGPTCTANTSLMFLPYLPHVECVVVRFEKGSLLAFTFLHTLTLGNNRIGNLQVNTRVTSCQCSTDFPYENFIIVMQQLARNVEHVSTATRGALGVFASRCATSIHWRMQYMSLYTPLVHRFTHSFANENAWMAIVLHGYIPSCTSTVKPSGILGVPVIRTSVYFNHQVSLGILRLMRHLRYLELSGNPLAEETGYRLLVIKNLPWLETLDMHKVWNRCTTHGHLHALEPMFIP